MALAPINISIILRLSLYNLCLVGVVISASKAIGQSVQSPAADFESLESELKQAQEYSRAFESETTPSQKWESIPRYGDDKFGDFQIEEIVEPSSEYHYSAFGRSDPFALPQITGLPTDSEIAAGRLPSGRMSLPKNATAQTIRSAEIPVVSPLQRFSLGSLEVKGIVVDGKGVHKALIMTPEKEGIIVTTGDPIAAGKVMDIIKDRVIVRQYSLREDGSREFTDRNLYLGTRQPDQPRFITLEPGGKISLNTATKDPKRPQEGRQPTEVAAAEPAKAPATKPAETPKTNDPETSGLAVPSSLDRDATEVQLQPGKPLTGGDSK